MKGSVKLLKVDNEDISKIRRCAFELKDASGKVVGEYKTDKMVRLTSKI